MAASKTRFGFFGNGDEPPESGDHGAARTVIGHDIHLQNLPDGFVTPKSPGSPVPMPIPPTSVLRTPLPPSAVMAHMPEVITESVPVRRAYRPQKSRLARFLGRWTTGGHFRSRSRMDATLLDDPGDDDVEFPRDTTGRNVLLVLVIAALTFLVTFALVKTRQRYAVAPPVTGTQAPGRQAARQPLPQPAPIVPARVVPVAPPERPALLGTPSAAVPPADHPRFLPHAEPPSPAKPVTVPSPSGSSAPPKHPPSARKGARPDPALDLPEHLRGELLPLGQ